MSHPPRTGTRTQEQALKGHPEFQPVRPGLQQSPAPPQSPEAIADLIRTVYVALQSSQLPGVTQVSSDALSAVLAEISAAQQTKTSQSPPSEPTADASSSSGPDGAASRPRWGDLPIGEEEQNDEDAFQYDAQDPEDMEEEPAEPFIEGAGQPPYEGDDPSQFEREGLYLTKRCRAGIKAVSQSKVLTKFQAPSRADPSHRGQGAFAAIRAAQRQSRPKADG